MYECLCVLQCLWRTKDVTGSFRTQSQMVVNCHVTVRNWAWVSCKSSQLSELLSNLSCPTLVLFYEELTRYYFSQLTMDLSIQIFYDPVIKSLGTETSPTWKFSIIFLGLFSQYHTLNKQDWTLIIIRESFTIYFSHDFQITCTKFLNLVFFSHLFFQ